jgi:arsenate reductase-like glutaredoxin family protein
MKIYGRLQEGRGAWRKLPESSKANLNETKALALLAKNASAIRRPIVEAGSRLLVGFDAAEFEIALKR